MIENEIDVYIEKQVKSFNISDSAIERMRDDYLPLTIKDIDDKQGYLTVHAARLDVKAMRVAVEKRRKEILEDAIKFQKAINGEAKRITSQLEEIEINLGVKEDQHKYEIERIKQEKLAKHSQRLFILAQHNAKIEDCIHYTIRCQNGRTWHYPIEWVKTATDEDFENRMHPVYIEFEIEKKKIEQELIERQKEDERLKAEREAIAKERAEIDAEKARMASENTQMEIKKAAAQGDSGCVKVEIVDTTDEDPNRPITITIIDPPLAPALKIKPVLNNTTFMISNMEFKALSRGDYIILDTINDPLILRFDNGLIDLIRWSEFGNE